MSTDKRFPWVLEPRDVKLYRTKSHKQENPPSHGESMLDFSASSIKQSML